MIDLSPVFLSLRLALVTTLVLLVIGIPIAYGLSESRSRLKPLWEALISMPLVLPPTVLGFYLLIAFSPSSLIGGWLEEWLGLRLAFSFAGLVIASVIYSLPFMVNPIHSALTSLPSSLREAAYVMGHSRFRTLLFVLLPNIKPALLSAAVLTFAHTIGEFGVVLMIGGNIPDKTKVASIAVYDQVESMQYAAAHVYSGILLVMTFSILLAVYAIRGRSAKVSAM